MIPVVAAQPVIQELGAAVKATRNTNARRHICSAVATLIATSGRYGGPEQQALMDFASSVGFRPEYYADTIRVSVNPGWQGTAR